MSGIPRLYKNNRRWAADITRQQPDFFQTLRHQQTPDYLWIGCADSRVPANEIVGMLPGELFVHRNIANLVVHTDLNCLSVIQYAVDVLKVHHIIVCGHYQCGGVEAVVRGQRVGLTDNWLHHLRDVYEQHRPALERSPDLDQRCRRLCELNVLEQTRNVARSTVLLDAWVRQQKVTVHACIYDVADGILHDLQLNLDHEASHADFSRALKTCLS